MLGSTRRESGRRAPARGTWETRMLDIRSLGGARVRTIAIAAPLITLLIALLAGSARADAPNFESGSGITVTATRSITARTFEADISTPLISPKALNAPNRIRVTLPEGYFQNPNLEYPVLYLLHGGAGGSASNWTTAGAEEEITADKDVITVMPDAGKVGWYTNWVNESQGPQRWTDFYFNQLIPLVDANLRTIADKDGRAVAGLSMGGYGSIRLAQDRPDLFGSVASFSGATDLGLSVTRLTVLEQSIQNALPPDGAFGLPIWPFDSAWNANDPMRRAARLRGLQVLLYAGGGSSRLDVIERAMQLSEDHFSGALTEARVPHRYWRYGSPGKIGPYACNGGHNWGCWNMALNDALPRMLSVLSPPVESGSEAT